MGGGSVGVRACGLLWRLAATNRGGTPFELFQRRGLEQERKEATKERSKVKAELRFTVSARRGKISFMKREYSALGKAGLLAYPAKWEDRQICLSPRELVVAATEAILKIAPSDSVP